MARSMWRGAIQFGLVTIPVKLYLATEQGGIGFNMLHKTCLNRIQMKIWCPFHEEVIPRSETVRRYEWSKDKYVVVTDEDPRAEDPDELNRQISAYASSHAEELSRNGIRNMTYYAESLSLFEFLLETEGKTFIREMCQALRRGTSMDEIVRRRKAYPNGLSQLEDAWVAWVRNSS